MMNSRGPWWRVTIGAIVGHAFCTGLAVVGGRIVALKISQRAVALVGGLLFFAFAFQALMYGAPGSDLVAKGR